MSELKEIVKSMGFRRDLPSRAELTQCVALRKDGTVRSIVVQSDYEVFAMGYFDHADNVTEEDLHRDNIVTKIRFHWIDCFSDEELLGEPWAQGREEEVKEKLAALREESKIANSEKKFVIGSLESLK